MRLIAVILALVGMGLFASLLPQTSFVSRSSGEVVDAIGPVWPSFAVEQVLDDVDIISEVRIWAAAGFDRGEAPIAASLLRQADREPVRQYQARIRSSKVLLPYVLVFPPYEPTPGEKLVLQLWVSTERENSAIFGTTKPKEHVTPPTLAGGPADKGTLAYEVIWRGTGWQAALEGSTPDLARLAGALAGTTLAVALALLSYTPPRVSRPLRNATRRVRVGLLSLASRLPVVPRAWHGDLGEQASDFQTSTARRALYVFPWLIPAFAILHYLSSNLILFRVSESIAVFVVTMATVTVAFVVCRLIFKTAAVAAALTGLLGIVFFSYGHVYIALGDRADDRFLLGLGLPIMLGLGALLIRRRELARKIRMSLNVGSVLLVLLPIYQIATDFHAGSRPQDVDPFDGFPGLDERLAEARDRLSRDQLRDIYYIILDEYPRSGSPPEFDNSEFVQQLENRGFYVAPQARSNYMRTYQSIPSSLNMGYVHEERSSSGGELRRRLLARAGDNALGRIMAALGYRYVHVASGSDWTNTSRNAAVVVEFTPAGVALAGDESEDPFAFDRARRLSGRFTDAFLRTTTARPFLPRRFDIQPEDPYAYPPGHPFRTLAWLDFMKTVGTMEGPKFVFAHLLKPHGPYSFDRHGNITFDSWGWPDDHDPTVSEAFYGQVIWLNGQMLEVIDAILGSSNKPPIIVVTSDHGYVRNDQYGHDILAAFLLPDPETGTTGGGESAVYPSITSVNHFRAILDYYFGLDLGLLDDKVYSRQG